MKTIISLGFVLLIAAAGWAEQRPNIIFVLADDLGWSDLGVQGSTYYETPHIDRLASQGMRWNRYHNCQNCTPTRAALLSGQYAARTPRTSPALIGSVYRGSGDVTVRPFAATSVSAHPGIASSRLASRETASSGSSGHICPSRYINPMYRGDVR